MEKVWPEELLGKLGEPDYIFKWEFGNGSIVEAGEYFGSLLSRKALTLCFKEGGNIAD